MKTLAKQKTLAGLQDRHPSSHLSREKALKVIGGGSPWVD
jgi:hypothetical protein